MVFFFKRTDKQAALFEATHDPDRAIFALENTLRHNPYNVKALTSIASICRHREQYAKVAQYFNCSFLKAVEYFQRVLNVETNNGEIWGALGHCWLMMDDLHKAYTAYQQALYHLPNPKVSIETILFNLQIGPQPVVWYWNFV